MKKLYHAKGKVHPSPDADSAFRFLPVAIATLSAALMPEDQEVLAYLIAWSLEEAVPDKQQSKRRPTSQGRIHRPAFDCSCFECYTSFWSRWDASPNRQLIHEALDLFEDHMATAGSDVAGRAPGRGKNHRRTSRDDNRKQLMLWLEQNRRAEGCPGRFCGGKERDGGDGMAVGMQSAGVPDVEVPEFGKGGGKAKQHAADVDFEDKARKPLDKMTSHSQARQSAAPAAGRGLMRRVFPDIMGFIAERLWTVWSPPV